MVCYFYTGKPEGRREAARALVLPRLCGAVAVGEGGYSLVGKHTPGITRTHTHTARHIAAHATHAPNILIIIIFYLYSHHVSRTFSGALLFSPQSLF